MESFIQSSLQADQHSIGVIAAVFVTGLLTSLTPCIYPMIPVTVSVVGNQATSRRHGLGLSLMYVIGLACVYSLLGILAASTGRLFGSVASHPVTLMMVSAFCLLMAAWILGWVRVPSGWSVPVISSPRPALNVFLSGSVSGLVMAPCTSPVLGMLLMYVAASGDTAWAATLMFVFAMGMSALLVLAGSLSGFLSMLPRSGHWLNASKWLMAALMSATALYFFSLAFFSDLQFGV